MNRTHDRLTDGLTDVRSDLQFSAMDLGDSSGDGRLSALWLKVPADGRTDGRADGRTDGRTDPYGKIEGIQSNRINKSMRN